MAEVDEAQKHNRKLKPVTLIKVLNFDDLDDVLRPGDIHFSRVGIDKTQYTVTFNFDLLSDAREGQHMAQLTFCVDQGAGKEFCFGEVFTITFEVRPMIIGLPDTGSIHR